MLKVQCIFELVEEGVIVGGGAALVHATDALKDFVPVIKNQGGYGTCVGWSTAYYGRTILNARIENLTDVENISKSAFSPVFT